MKKFFAQTDSERLQVTLTPDLEMATNTSVWDALRLTPEQTGRLAGAANEYYLAISQRNWSDPPLPAEQLAAAVEGFTRSVNPQSSVSSSEND